jgi:hypothetical protein
LTTVSSADGAAGLLIAGDFFSIAMGIDATWKQGGRNSLEEICVYRVRDGKIVLEQFFDPVG